jgi:glutaredoxin
LKTKWRKRGYVERLDIEAKVDLEMTDVTKMTPEERVLYIKNKLQIQ